MTYGLSDVEALRLMRAFNQIDDPKTRRILIAGVEAIARGAMGDVDNPEQELGPRPVGAIAQSWL
jgi:hypothetical protein